MVGVARRRRSFRCRVRPCPQDLPERVIVPEDDRQRELLFDGGAQVLNGEQEACIAGNRHDLAIWAGDLGADRGRQRRNQRCQSRRMQPAARRLAREVIVAGIGDLVMSVTMIASLAVAAFSASEPWRAFVAVAPFCFELSRGFRRPGRYPAPPPFTRPVSASRVSPASASMPTVGG